MPKKTDSDLKLVKKSLQDINAFGELMNSYEEKLLRYILRISHFSVPEAEDILQEVFLKAWKNLNDFDQSLSFSSWIYRITHNHTISQYRRSKTRGEDKKVSLDEKLYHLSSEELNIGEQLDRKEKAKTIRRILNQLSENSREVLILKYFEDKSYEEISDILKKPMGTVATLLNRAKKSFQDEVQKSFLENQTIIQTKKKTLLSSQQTNF